MTTKKKTVNYRRCLAKYEGDGDSPSKFSLQHHLETVMSNGNRPWIRPIGISGTESQLLAHLMKKQACICGALVVCASKLIPLVDTESDGSTFEATVPPKDQHGKTRRVEEHALFFAIRENHVAVIQSKELSISDLEDFFTWLIQSKEKLAEDFTFSLVNLPSKAAMESLKNHSIKSIQFGKAAFWQEKGPKEKKPGAKRSTHAKVLKSDSGLIGVLKTFLGNDAIIEELEKDEDPGSLHVNLEISYRSKSEHAAQKLMKSLAATIGDREDLSPEIKLTGGQRSIKGGDLTIKDGVEVQSPSGNVSKEDAMTVLAKWLAKAIAEGKVTV